MEPIAVPEDLSELGEADIVALANDVKSRLRALSELRLTRDIVDEMTGLRADLDRINTRAVQLDDERRDIEAAAAAALEGIDGHAADGAAETVEAAADGTVEMATAVDSDEDDAADGEEDGDKDDEDGDKAEAAADTIVPLSARDGLRALQARQAGTAAGRATVPVVVEPEAKPFGVAAAGRINLPQGRSIEAGSEFSDLAHLSDVVCQLQQRNSRQTMSGRSYEYVGHADLFAPEADRLAESDPVMNFAMLNRVSDPTAASQALQSLVASGTLCPPDNPIYDFFRLAVPQAPVEAAMPTVPAPRGGIRYIQTPDFRTARAAIGTRTAAENADPETPDKPCSRAVCPNVAEAYVTAVSECVRWDNLQYRAFPELVANYMADVAVNFASVKECLYLTAIDAASTNVNADVPVYGAMRALAYQLRMAASGYRKRQNMRRDAQLVWYAPNWLPDILLADMINDHSLGLEFLTRGTEGLVSQVISALNVTPVWYNDQANCGTTWTGDLQAWRPAQSAGGLNQWPSAVVSYLHAPGEFVRLDSGSLDVGLVRDSTLNGTNDLELFMEQWVGVVHLGLEAIKINHRLCPSGTAPEPVPEFDCIGFAS